MAALSAPAPTRVVDVRARPGLHVAKGAVLVALETAVFDAAEQGAKAALDAAERNQERTRGLVEAGIAPRRDLEQADAALATARSDLTVAARNRELATMRAPFDGVVTRVTAVLGAAVDVGEVLVEIADPSSVDVVLALQAAEAARVRAGAAVSLRTGETPGSAPIGKGTVAEVGGIVDAETRSVAVRVVATAVERPLRIGETVFGDITVSVARAAVVVPGEALVPDGDGFKVFVVDSGDVAHARTVEVGARREDLVRILSGVRAGERVVTYGAYGIEDGATVLPVRP
jgi:membrane fusion protein (multidrug efflux system)